MTSLNVKAVDEVKQRDCAVIKMGGTIKHLDLIPSWLSSIQVQCSVQPEASDSSLSPLFFWTSLNFYAVGHIFLRYQISEQLVICFFIRGLKKLGRRNEQVQTIDSSNGHSLTVSEYGIAVKGVLLAECILME